MPIDHSKCDHPATKAGRAACRRSKSEDRLATHPERETAQRADKARARVKRDRTKVLADGTIRLSEEDRLARVASWTPEQAVWVELRERADLLPAGLRGELDMKLASAALTWRMRGNIRSKLQEITDLLFHMEG